MTTLKFKTNLNCGNCVAKVTPILNNEDEIKSWMVDTENPQKILIVEAGNIDEEQVVKLVNKAGFKAEAV